MITAYWNALRVGDAVLVHLADQAVTAPPVAAHVAIVDTTRRPHGVGLHLDAPLGTGTPPYWPSRLAVHLTLDHSELCSYCTPPHTSRSSA